jgi:DNA-binding XRE family transcriptional regulator
MTTRIERALTSEATPIPPADLSEYFYDALHGALNSLRVVFHRLHKEDGLTQDMIATRISAPKSVVSRVFRGRTNPTLKTLNAIARGMGCRLQIIFEPLKDLRPPNHHFVLGSGKSAYLGGEPTLSPRPTIVLGPGSTNPLSSSQPFSPLPPCPSLH